MKTVQMRSIGFCFVVAASALLLGCAAPGGKMAHGGRMDGAHPPKPKAAKCKDEGASCNVVLTVGCDGSECWLSGDPDYISIAAGKKIKITFTIATGGYKFDPSKGIVILDTPPQEFNCAIDAHNPAQYHCTNQHSVFGVYKYVATAVNDVGYPPVPPYDPFVIND